MLKDNQIDKLEKGSLAALAFGVIGMTFVGGAGVAYAGFGGALLLSLPSFNRFISKMRSS